MCSLSRSTNSQNLKCGEHASPGTQGDWEAGKVPGLGRSFSAKCVHGVPVVTATAVEQWLTWVCVLVWLRSVLSHLPVCFLIHSRLFLKLFFFLGGTPRFTQGLLLALHLGNTLGRLRVKYRVLGMKLRSAAYTLPTVLFIFLLSLPFLPHFKS